MLALRGRAESVEAWVLRSAARWPPPSRNAAALEDGNRSLARDLPVLTFVLWLAGPTIRDWPVALRTLALTVVIVPLMVFVLIPGIQRLLSPWLRRQ